MIQAGKNYVYGTAAEKLEYDVYEGNKVLKDKKRQRANNKAKLKMVCNILIVFAACFTVMYRYALITDLGYNIHKANKTYKEVLNENTRLKIAIEKEMDLNKVREIAETKLGMHKPYKHQIIYVKVPKNDFTKIPDDYNQTGNTVENLFAMIFERVGKFASLLY